MDPVTKKLVETIRQITEETHAPGVEPVAGWLAGRLKIPVGDITSHVSNKLNGSTDLGEIEKAFHGFIEDHPAVDRLRGRDSKINLADLEHDLKQDVSHELDRYYSSR